MNVTDRLRSTSGSTSPERVSSSSQEKSSSSSARRGSLPLLPRSEAEVRVEGLALQKLRPSKLGILRDPQPFDLEKMASNDQKLLRTAIWRRFEEAAGGSVESLGILQTLKDKVGLFAWSHLLLKKEGEQKVATLPQPLLQLLELSTITPEIRLQDVERSLKEISQWRDLIGEEQFPRHLFMPKIEKLLLVLANSSSTADLRRREKLMNVVTALSLIETNHGDLLGEDGQRMIIAMKGRISEARDDLLAPIRQADSLIALQRALGRIYPFKQAIGREELQASARESLLAILRQDLFCRTFKVRGETGRLEMVIPMVQLRITFQEQTGWDLLIKAEERDVEEVRQLVDDLKILTEWTQKFDEMVKKVGFYRSKIELFSKFFAAEELFTVVPEKEKELIAYYRNHFHALADGLNGFENCLQNLKREGFCWEGAGRFGIEGYEEHRQWKVIVDHAIASASNVEALKYFLDWYMPTLNGRLTSLDQEFLAELERELLISTQMRGFIPQKSLDLVQFFPTIVVTKLSTQLVLFTNGEEKISDRYPLLKENIRSLRSLFQTLAERVNDETMVAQSSVADRLSIRTVLTPLFHKIAEVLEGTLPQLKAEEFHLLHQLLYEKGVDGDPRMVNKILLKKLCKEFHLDYEATKAMIRNGVGAQVAQ